MDRHCRHWWPTMMLFSSDTYLEIVIQTRWRHCSIINTIAIIVNIVIAAIGDRKWMEFCTSKPLIVNERH